MNRPLPLDKILEGDCVERMAELPAESVDLVFADPPYNLQLRKELYRPDLSRVDAVDDSWDQFESVRAYDAFTRGWIDACSRVLKPTGTLWVIGTYHNIFRVGTALMDSGYWILNEVAWIKANPMPQFRGVRLTNAHETLIWARPPHFKEGYTFHYKLAKALNGGKQMRSDWYIPLCTGRERLRADGAKLHTTQKPEALLERVVRICSSRGDVVLDPFFGSGTTGAVCRRWGRRFIGIEREPEYIRAARDRIDRVQEVAPDALERESQQAPPGRIPFASLLREGLLLAGTRLRFGQNGPLARVEPTGELSLNGARGSIHKMGALAAGAPACNGWEHWHYQDPATGEFRTLDSLRKVIRQRRQLSTGQESAEAAL